MQFIWQHILEIGYCLFGLAFAMLCGAIWVIIDLYFEVKHKG